MEFYQDTEPALSDIYLKNALQEYGQLLKQLVPDDRSDLKQKLDEKITTKYSWDKVLQEHFNDIRFPQLGNKNIDEINVDHSNRLALFNKMRDQKRLGYKNIADGLKQKIKHAKETYITSEMQYLTRVMGKIVFVLKLFIFSFYICIFVVVSHIKMQPQCIEIILTKS